MTADAEISRKDIAVIVGEGGDSDIEAFVMGIPAERLAPTILSIRAIRKALMKAEAWAEGRFGDEVNVPYIEPDSGEMYVFQGDATWVVKDEQGFKAALQKLAKDKPLWAMRIREAWTDTVKFSHSGLNTIRDLDDEIGEIVNEFRSRKFGPKHLKKYER